MVGNTGGRPLGLAVARDGRLLICDSHRGLLAMDTATGEFETLVDEVEGRRLKFCSNVVETSDGTIFFTESTDRLHYEHYKGAVLEARGRAACSVATPTARSRRVVPGLHFANGVTLTADESAVVFAETQGRRVSKYWLTGPKAGTVTPLATTCPACPTTSRPAPTAASGCAMVTPANATADRLATRRADPPQGAVAVARPAAAETEAGGVGVAFDPDGGEAVAGLRTTHPSFALVTGVVEADGRLWMASIGAPAVAYFDLAATALR